ncbi:MAG: MBL fold metallo-hydrolase [Candidatus Verstraetearchaeota archaeon]|nr:MBL fold metallo-hydrolase [Candidatus Verstraetearchaeota archaeon]
MIKANGKLWLIEAGGDPFDLIKALNLLDINPKQLEGVFLTHGHSDHVTGLIALQGKSTPIYLHHRDLSILPQCIAQDIEGQIVKLRGGEKFEISEDLEMRVLHSPGHTPGSCCYYLPSEGILFSGDTVFTGGFVGRTDLPGGNFKLLVQSLQTLSHLEVQHLLPSHGPPALNNGKAQLLYALRTLL